MRVESTNWTCRNSQVRFISIFQCVKLFFSPHVFMYLRSKYIKIRDFCFCEQNFTHDVKFPSKGAARAAINRFALRKLALRVHYEKRADSTFSEQKLCG